VARGLRDRRAPNALFRFNDPALTDFKRWNNPFDPCETEILIPSPVDLDERLTSVAVATADWLDCFFRRPTPGG
jgi:hypothetical protein